MSISLEKIYYTAIRKYNMKLVCGRGGIWNTISWIHIVEDIEVAGFLQGRELVVTTGVKKPSNEEILDFVKAMVEADASGVVFNVGHYINEIPTCVIEYAEKKGFPIFSLPWEVHLVDFNRDLCNQIMKADQSEDNLCSIMRNYIYKFGGLEETRKLLIREGIAVDARYCMIKCLPTFENVDEEHDYTKLFLNMRMHFSRYLNHNQKKYIIFRKDYLITVVAIGVSEDETRKMVDYFAEFSMWNGIKGSLNFAVSRNELELEELPNIYESLTLMCRLNVKHERIKWFWKDLGEWEIILLTHNQVGLSEFEKHTIGVLEQYDSENGSNMCELLDLYLEYNGNMPKVAEKLYVHRNTVSYHLKKIEELLGCDIYNISDRVSIYTALRIRELNKLA